MIVRRILVAIDASPGSGAAVRTTAWLAARLRAELVGLFVEDARLLTLVESPLAREVDTLTAGRHLPESESARRQLRLQGLRAREELRRFAERESVDWTFRVARGSVSAEIAEAAGEGDIVGLGSVGWSHRPQRVLGELASALLERRGGYTLLIKRKAEVGLPIVVLFDGSPEATRALRVSAQLAADDESQVTVCPLGVGEEALDRALEEVFAERGRVVLDQRLEAGDERRLRTGLLALAPGIALLPLAGEATNQEILLRLLDELDCPVLLVS